MDRFKKKVKDIFCLSIARSIALMIFSMILLIYIFANGRNHSAWFGTVAFYYMILSMERFLLLKHIRKKQRDSMEEYKKYSFCGYLLLILTIALIGMGSYMIHNGKVTVYPGHIIFAAAGYTFYTFITAILNIVKYRKLKNPIYSASKMITLATALISVFSLQTAMFEAFGKDVMQQRQMNILTGFCVFVMIIAMAIFMIIYGRHSIKVIQQKQQLP